LVSCRRPRSNAGRRRPSRGLLGLGQTRPSRHLLDGPKARCNAPNLMPARQAVGRARARGGRPLLQP